MLLNDLQDRPGARKTRKRIGRGPGSGTGKTAGKGHKGQKARSGVSVKGFEGGQTPLYRRLPKRGFNNSLFRKNRLVVNLGQLENAIALGKIDAKKPINHEICRKAGLIGRKKGLLCLLAKGELKQAGLEIHIDHVSKTAREMIEKKGGKIILLEAKKIEKTKKPRTKKSETEKSEAKSSEAKISSKEETGQPSASEKKDPPAG